MRTGAFDLTCFGRVCSFLMRHETTSVPFGGQYTQVASDSFCGSFYIAHHAEFFYYLLYLTKVVTCLSDVWNRESPSQKKLPPILTWTLYCKPATLPAKTTKTRKAIKKFIFFLFSNQQAEWFVGIFKNFIFQKFHVSLRTHAQWKNDELKLKKRFSAHLAKFNFLCPFL